MKTFNDLGLAEPILKAVAAEGYIHPTPIQSKAVSVLLSGQDVLGIAQTGTGKTAAFVLPLLHKLAQQRHRGIPKMCGALILAPTRELATQIVENIEKYSSFMRISTALLIGGVRPGEQIRTLKTGADIVVATPGRLLDHISTGAIILAKTQLVVIDEADQMLDLGFLPDIRNILKKLPQNRQTSLFSATMPGQIRKLSNDFLTNPTEIKVAATSKPIEQINQSVRYVKQSEKRNVLAQILSDANVERTVVFTRTKRGADKVCQYLTGLQLRAQSIHGDKSQEQREAAIADFRSGKTTILVATDIAARGIDIDDVTHVVNFDIPNVAEAYVHRIGRTARAGKSGFAISLCDPSEQKLLSDIEKLIGSPLEQDNEHKQQSSSNISRSPKRKLSETSCLNIEKEKDQIKRRRAGRKKHVSSPSSKIQVRQHATSEQSTSGLKRMLANINI